MDSEENKGRPVELVLYVKLDPTCTVVIRRTILRNVEHLLESGDRGSSDNTMVSIQ